MSTIAIPRPSYRGERAAPSHGSRLNRLFVFLIIFLAVVLTLELLFHFLVAPRLLIRHVEIQAASGFPISNRELIAAAGLNKPTYYYSVSDAQIVSRLEAYPLIKSASVQKVFPNGLRISITERKPLVVSLVNEGGHTVPVAFAADGVAVEVGRSVGTVNMPIISGVSIPTIQPGMKLPGALVAFLAQLQKIREESPVLFSQISEIKFERHTGSSFSTVIYPSTYRVPVIIGDTIDVHQLKYVMMVLDVVQQQGMINKLQDLDFRAGKVVYKLKGGSQSASG